MLDFPATPTDGLLYPAPNGVTYQYQTPPGLWVSAGSPGGFEDEVISVRDFGAVGDGVADDTMAIQAAIDYVRDQGGGIVDFPRGTYKLMQSTLGEVFGNAEVVVSSYSLALRSGVSLRGQLDRSAILSTVSAVSGIAIALVDPIGCTIEGFELVGPHTQAAFRANQGMMTVSAAGMPFEDPARVCRNNTFRNLYIHGIGGYGIGFQNASPVNCRIEDCDFYNIGGAGVDSKARLTPAVAPIGNSISNVTVRNHGNYNDDAGLDLRGVWQLSNITVSEFGNNPGEPGYGIRFRNCPTPAQVDSGHMDWAEAAQYSTLTNFYVKADPAANAVFGVTVGSDDVHVSNGTVEGCHFNYAVITAYVDITAASWTASVATITVANDLRVGDHFAVRGMIPTGYNGEDLIAVTGTTATVIKYAVAVNPGVATTLGRYVLPNWLPRGVTFANITSKDASVYGCHLQIDAEDTSVIGYVSYNSGTAGIRNEGINTKIMGFGSNGDATPMTVSGDAAPTMTLFNGPDTGSITLGGGMSVAARINIDAPIVGGGNAYAVNVTSDVGAGVTNGYGYSTTLGAAAGVATNLRHFFAQQATLAGTITNQYGFYAHSSLAGGSAINAGFYGLLPAAATNWNVRCDGGAQNYFLGNVGIGSGKTAPTVPLDVAGNVLIDGSAGSAQLDIAAGTDTQARVVLRTGATARWLIEKNSTAETGSGNTGADLAFTPRDDAGGNTIGNALVLTRSTMQATFGGNVDVVGAAGGNRRIRLLAGTTPRWSLDKNNNAETGTGNTGSDFAITNYNDAGTAIANPLSIVRATGLVAVNRLQTAGSTTAGAGLRMIHGVAPTTPADGDIWTTTAGMFVRINGVTKTVTLT